MTFKVFHQCGHNTIWNLKSSKDDGTGDGLIVSPVHYEKEKVEKVDLALRKRSIFDPQFYLPNSKKDKLKTYPFFPEVIAGGFSTENYGVHALSAAQQCIEFQLQSDFESILIPARYFEQMDPEYTRKQEGYTVIPFLKILSSIKKTKKYFLTLPTTVHMLKSKVYRTDLLNWVTKFPEIDGVYIFAGAEGETKQIQDSEAILSYLEFVQELSKADLEVIVGYTNTEGLLFSLIDKASVSFGTFENTRMFSIDKFVKTDEERRGPKARIFLSGLLNWIEFGQAKSLRKMAPDLWKKIYHETSYAEAVLESPAEPTFNQPPLYLHHFKAMQALFDQLKKRSVPERHALLRDWLKGGIENYGAIERLPFDIEKHGGGAHLQPWLDAINAFYAKHIKPA